jgi:polyphosphate kinase 2 (PPK2 family)
MNRKEYTKALRTLQVELCTLQDWIKEQGLRVVVVFEGRDAAGKGGTIKAITDRVSPRVFRVVALPAPSDREKSQVKLPARSMKDAYDDRATFKSRRFVPEKY